MGERSAASSVSEASGHGSPSRCRHEVSALVLGWKPGCSERSYVHAGFGPPHRQSDSTHNGWPQSLLLVAVQGAFGLDVDFATLHKLYEIPEAGDGERRYNPARVHRMQGSDDHWQSRSRAHLDVLCRAPEPHHENEHEALHAANKCILKESR